MGQWLQILIPLIIFGGGFLQWLARKLQEERVRKDQARLKSKLEEEFLRTGRAPASSVPAPATAPSSQATDADQLLAMRRAQLEELQRQALARAGRTGMTSGTTVPMPTRSVPRPPARPQARSQPGQQHARPAGAAPPRPTQPGRSGPPQPRPGQPGPGTRTPQRTAGGSRTQPAPKRTGAEGRTPPGSRSRGPAPELLVEELPIERPTARLPQATAAASVAYAPRALGTLSRSTLRQAIILSEVLGPPLALRQE